MARKKSFEPPTIDELEALAAEAAAGDNAALDELGALNEQIGRIMNKRMRRLESAGKTGDAYKRIGNTLGMDRPRFSQAHTGSAESLFDTSRKALAAYHYTETTLSGIKEVDVKTVDSVLDAFGKNSDSYTQKQKLQIADFLKTDAWKQLKSLYGSEALEAITDAAMDDDFEEALNAFAEFDVEMSDTDIVELSEQYFDFDQEF